MRKALFLICIFCSALVYSLSDDWYAYFTSQCNEAGVPISVAGAILYKENPGLDPNAVSKVNRNGSRDYGLWQLNSRYLWDDFVHQYWHFQEAFDWSNPYHSTYIALRHLKWLYQLFWEQPTAQSKSWSVILAYNCGYYAVASGKVPASSVTYAVSVFNSVWK